MSDTPICEFYSYDDKTNVTLLLNRGPNGQLLFHNVNLIACENNIQIEIDKHFSLDKIIAPGENIIGAPIDFIEARLYQASDPNNYYRFIAQDLRIHGFSNSAGIVIGGIVLKTIDDTLPILMYLQYIRKESTNANSKTSNSNNR